MSTYNIVASSNESTVVSEYKPEVRHVDSYQSEDDLEKEFIENLEKQGYEYLSIHEEKDLVVNLRKQLELLNNYQFSEKEWNTFYFEKIANKNEGIVEKTRRIQEDYVQVLKRDDGTSMNISLIDKKNIHNNRLQVINQYEVSSNDGAKYDNRYDVTILVNGLPLVHVELKRRGVALKEAFNQINRYQRDSFWAGSGLYEYIQIFVISNGTHTKYYSNTTRESRIKEEKDNSAKKNSKKTSNSFEFTSYWADSKNKTIVDLVDFTKTFFAKHTILSILTRYCIFTTQDILLVMRPYQIAATEAIIQRIKISTNYKRTGSVEAGGYVWHTTGSGKTLTSFKTAQLVTQLDSIEKVLFVVDRADLDYQTMKEYDRFQKGAANSNKSTKILQQQLEDPNAKIIITTIQKLSVFISKNKGHEIFKKHVVLIFDECHRSQFGTMHTAIIKNFKNYHIFGFTGTPIFTANASMGGMPDLKTTEQAFGDKLHIYTIVDAINDGNVLPFRIDYINTIKSKENMSDSEVEAINTEKALSAPERISEVTKYILDHFDQKTKRTGGAYYTLEGKRVNGFNSLFAVSSIPVAKKYYYEFKKQMAELPDNQRLSIAVIYSYGANDDEEESFDTESLDKNDRDFLEEAIMDYNMEFHTNYDTSSDKFHNYYKDLSQRMKKREVDLVIVVNMFLTGFDATTMNTLWVDKNLKMHGLIQAFSRTNRILNAVKTYGNIVCFRDLQKATDDAISLFGDKEAGGVILLKDYDSYYYGYDDEKGVHHDGYAELLNKLHELFPVNDEIIGEENMKKFISLFNALLRVRNILTDFDQFAEDDTMLIGEFQDYQSKYLDIRNVIVPSTKKERVDIIDDIEFEMELIKQVDINIDYILALVEKYHSENCTNKEISLKISKTLGSSPQLRSKKQLIEEFLNNLNASSDIGQDWKTYIAEQKEKEISKIISEEKLKDEPTRKFLDDCFRDGYLKTTGTEISSILPAMSLFGGGNRADKKQVVIDKLLVFFDKYFGV